MHTKVLMSHDQTRAIMLRSHHNRSHTRDKAVSEAKRAEAQWGSKSYRDGLQRAFNKAKQQIYFNPDMTLFITFTYVGAEHTHDDVMRDIKIFMKSERRRAKRPIKYIYVMEYQKRGSIHVHMIANDVFTLNRNKNGYYELSHWPHGFTSVLRINDFDDNFRPHLYLFKYMKKAQRIGQSFLHSSRNLGHSYDLTPHQIDIMNWRTINMEYTHAKFNPDGNERNYRFYTNYLQFDDTMQGQPLIKENYYG